jgi:hypothetical protein
MENNWISVENELPPLREYVLVYNTEGAILVAHRYVNAWVAFFSDGERDMGELTATHWQPLPSPPTCFTAGAKRGYELACEEIDSSKNLWITSKMLQLANEIDVLKKENEQNKALLLETAEYEYKKGKMSVAHLVEARKLFKPA